MYLHCSNYTVHSISIVDLYQSQLSIDGMTRANAVICVCVIQMPPKRTVRKKVKPPQPSRAAATKEAKKVPRPPPEPELDPNDPRGPPLTSTEQLFTVKKKRNIVFSVDKTFYQPVEKKNKKPAAVATTS